MQRVALGHKMFSRRFDLYLPRDDRGRGFAFYLHKEFGAAGGFAFYLHREFGAAGVCILATQRINDAPTDVFDECMGAIFMKMAIFKG